MRLALLLGLAWAAITAVGQPTDADLLSAFQFRNIGPAATGGRIVDIEAHPAKPFFVLAASASGGVWRSVNNGTTWQPVFDDSPVSSIGDIAIAPSNPDIVWVGTGEHNNQRSCHFGDGVYKSVDGGKTWTNVGLKESLHIGRIAIDPKQPDIVYVASAGPLYKGGGERGVYKTTDGGKTWTRILEGPNDTTGFIDIAINPKDGKTLYACAYDRLRRAWHIRDNGPGSGVYRSKDAGKTWTKLTKGLPANPKNGRIGVAVYAKDPKIVYLTWESMAERTTIDIYRSADGGDSWTKMNDRNAPGGYYYGQIRVDPEVADRIYVPGVQLGRSDDGGKTMRSINSRVHVDFHAIWVDPSNNNKVYIGNDGGFYVTYDGGETYDFVNNLPIPQFYAIGADMALPYNVFGGFQDNGVWHGPSRTRKPSGISNDDWINILGGDGFIALADPEDPSTIYTSSQFGALARVDVKRRRSVSIRPRDRGLRCNWMTPFIISPHNAKTVYWGAQRLFKSLNRGDSWVPVSEDLTTNDPEKTRGNVPHCTITSIDESPVRQGVLWVGTDDGNVWVTENDGVTWTQVNGNIPGAPKNWWVSRVHASPHDAGTAFVTFTGYREDDFTPYVFKTDDYGKTWKSIVSNLPNQMVSVVKQDAINPKLLFVGTEQGLFASLDGGGTWNRFMPGVPTVPCQDLIIHPREGDLIVGTHGRGAFITNITPLRQLTDEIRGKAVHLFDPDGALAFEPIGDMFDEFSGHRRYAAPNPPDGAAIWYYLKEEPATEPKVEILDATGAVIREFAGTKKVGLNRVQWNLRQGRALVPAAEYGVRLTLGETTIVTKVKVTDWIR